jgi:hypothetical protein
LITDPSVETVVPPDESISRDVTYVVPDSDQIIGAIDNAAVVTVRPTTGPDLTERTGVAQATVTSLRRVNLRRRPRRPPTQSVSTTSSSAAPKASAPTPTSRLT